MAWELVHSLIDMSPLSGDEELRDICGHLLRWIQCPQLEVVIAVVATINLLASSTEQKFPANLHALLTNALVNRATNPSAFSVDSSSAQTNRTDNVHRSSMLVMDMCCNALIDLHSSDDADYLASFVKMNIGQKMLQVQQELAQRYGVYKVKLLAEEDKEKIEETLLNITNFLQYKHSHISK